MFYDKLLAKVFSCPQCRGEMQEVHRSEENGHLFIWLECVKPECSGQWLHKIPLEQKQHSGSDDDDYVTPNVLTR